MLKRLIILILLSTSVAAVVAQRTTRKGLKDGYTSKANTKIVKCDTLFDPSSEQLSLAGYDKPLRSAHESIFITNHTEKTICSIQLKIDYIDTKGRMLHSRTIDLPCDIPPHQTRQLTFKSWDKQQSFVYFRSQRPRRADHTDYDIRCNAIYCLSKN